MNKLKFFIGLGMLLAPFLIAFLSLIKIDFLQVIVGGCILFYVSVAFFLIINGAISDDDNSY